MSKQGKTGRKKSRRKEPIEKESYSTSLKAYAALISHNPVFVILGVFFSFIGLILSAFGASAAVKIVVVVGTLFIMLFLLGVLLQRWLTYVKLRAQAERNVLKEIGQDFQAFFRTLSKSVAEENPDFFNHGAFESNLVILCSIIGRIVEKMLRANVASCIKIVDTDSLFNEAINEWKIKTLARCTKSDNKRIGNDLTGPKLVKDNTDFYDIVNGRNAAFISPNLKETETSYEKLGFEYRNTTFRYEKFYKSTIVYPIRVRMDKLRARFANLETPDKDYHVVGFLCIDSLDTFEDYHEDFVLAAQYVNAFADSLYVLLERHLVNQLGYVKQVAAAEGEDK